MPEAHAGHLHHPRDYVAACVARPQAAPQIRFRRHAQTRCLVVVKRTAPEQVLAVRLRLDFEARHQTLDRDFLL